MPAIMLAVLGPVPQAARAEVSPISSAAPVAANRAEHRTPNVLVIMTDDVGYAASSSFGSLIQTPTFDRLSETGLRYNNFHTTALCSPTRAALLTGRNSHAVGMGNITESASEDPGYTSAIPKSAATVARVLRDGGYHTAAFGKYHLIPKWELSSAGPKPHWPNQLGFEYFYGFEPAMTDQFTPDLIENMNFVRPPSEPGHDLNRALADKAIQWLRDARATDPGKPFFMYYATGTAHAPVQAPAEWIAKYRGKFDQGWDAARQEIFARQKKLGIIPANAVLTQRTEGIPAWATLTADQKRIYARYMEIYAGALSYADFEMGRVIDEIRAEGELDNTIVIYIQGDNGASHEGGLEGRANYYDIYNGLPEDQKETLAQLDSLGGPTTAPAIPIGWTNMLDTPFRYWKTRADTRGGVANGFVISWPNGIKSHGEIRTQFHTISDIVPTIYELTGVAVPESVDGVKQQPITGISMAYSFEAPKAPSHHSQQYFETTGSMSMYKEGWWASYTLAPGEVLNADLQSKGAWELYDLRTDFSQSKDVAKSHPDKVAELKAAFREDALLNNVFPITRRHTPSTQKRATDAPGHYEFYAGSERYSDYGFPNLKGRSWTMVAAIDVPPSGGSGIVINQGGFLAGWGLVLLKGEPTFIYKGNNSAPYKIVLGSGTALSPGMHEVQVEVTQESRAGEAVGVMASLGGAAIVISVDGRKAAEGHLEATPRNYFQLQGAAVGHSTGSPLTDAYRGDFPYNGRIERISIDVKPKPPR